MDDPDTDSPFSSRPPFRLGDARVDPSALRIEQAGTSQRVEAKVMEVLLVLAQEPGQVISRQELDRQVWPGRVVTDDALTNAVAKLRRALGDDPRRPRLVETIAKRGYRLKLAPEPLHGEAGPAPSTHPRSRWATGRRWAAATLLALVVIGTLVLWFRTPREPATPAPRPPAETSIAVIPFDVLGAEPEQQAWFAEGITLDLITELSRIPGLLVIAPGTSFGYRESAEDDGAIAEALGVEHLIRGAVQRFGERIRIHVRLLEADRGRTLWAERFAGDTGSLFRIQDEVVAGIANALPVRLALPRQTPSPGGATRSVAAYDAFLRGRERYGRLTPEDNRAARRHFEQAIELDPGFARAHAGLALAWSRLAIDGWTSEPQAALAKAAGFAETAAAIDPSIPQIHFVLAQVALFSGRHAEAAAAAERAIAIDPNYADAYALLAWILNYAGRPDQAELALREALRRNPRGSATYHQIAGEIRFARGRYTEAAQELEAALGRNPAHTRARLWLAATLSRLGRAEEAEWEVQELLAINPDFALSRLLLAFPLKDTHPKEALFAELARLDLPE